MLVIFRPENQDILVSGSPKLQLLDPTVSSGLLGCWGLGVGVRIQSTTAVHSRSVGQLLGTNSRGFWPILGDLKP